MMKHLIFGCSAMFGIGLLAAETKPFSIVQIGDPQELAKFDPQAYIDLTKWIAANKEERNIVFVGCVGDVVVDAQKPEQSEAASKAFEVLDGNVLYAIGPGNHDYDDWNRVGNHRMLGDLTTYYKYFPTSRFSKQNGFAGSREGSADTYYLFSAGNLDFIAVVLEMDPGDASLAWASEVLKKNADRRAILVTHNHSRMGAGIAAAIEKRNFGNVGANHRQRVGKEANTPDAVFDKLLKNHPNVFLTLSGHNADITFAGKNIYDDLLFQSASYAGATGKEARIRCFTFFPDQNKIQVSSVFTSPAESIEKKLTDVDYDMTPKPAIVGSPVITPANGFQAYYFKEPVEVKVSCPTEGAKIHYTLEGTFPTESSPSYSTPLKVSTTTVISARAFKSGMTPSWVEKVVYVKASDGSGLSASYFAGEALEGEPLLKRIDPTIDFEWRNRGGPIDAFAKKPFSCRWIGKLSPPFDGKYVFYGWSDAGFRLWIDGQPLLDKWRPLKPKQAADTEEGVVVELKAAQEHEIKVESMHKDGVRDVRLSWMSDFLPREVIPQSQLKP